MSQLWQKNWEKVSLTALLVGSWSEICFNNSWLLLCKWLSRGEKVRKPLLTFSGTTSWLFCYGAKFSEWNSVTPFGVGVECWAAILGSQVQFSRKFSEIFFSITAVSSCVCDFLEVRKSKNPYWLFLELQTGFLLWCLIFSMKYSNSNWCRGRVLDCHFGEPGSIPKNLTLCCYQT